jgi:hypothetical protein
MLCRAQRKDALLLPDDMDALFEALEMSQLGHGKDVNRQMD